MVQYLGLEVDLQSGPLGKHHRAMGIGLVLALAAALAYGASDFVGGTASRRHSPWAVVLVGQLCGAALMAGCGLLAPADPRTADVAWALLAGAGSATGSIFLYRGLSRGRMGLVAPVSAVGAAALPVLVGVALDERPTWLAWLGVVVALPGIWLVSRGSTASAAGTRGALVDGAAAGAGFGVLFVALAQVSSDAGFMPLAVNQLVGAAVTVVVAATLGQEWRPRPGGVLPWGAASGALGAAGTVTFLLSTHATDLGVAAVLASLYPAVTVVLASLTLGERLGGGQRLGIGICTLAVAALAIG
jgi:drug/metabolite transporter (DMT)-like permease